MNAKNKIQSRFMFKDRSPIYNNINKQYNIHKKGYIILGPPGIGKTTFVKNQKEIKKNWIDRDFLFSKLGVKWHHNEKNATDFIVVKL